MSRKSDACFLIQVREIEPGTESVYGVPTGTPIVYFAHLAEVVCPGSVDYWGGCGRGLSPNEAIEDVKRLSPKEYPTEGE